MWRPIRDYEGIYEVSGDGRVRRVAEHPPKFHMQEQALCPQPNGYWMVRLSKPGQKRRNRYIHRLVADAFIPNPDNLPEVNHDNGNTDENDKDNLYWTDRSGNCSHKNRVLFTHHNQTDFEVTHPNGHKEIIKNLTEFSETHGLSQSGLQHVLAGRRSHHRGFTASYVSRKD